MKCRFLLLLFIFAGCSTNAQQTDNKPSNQNKAASRKANDTAIYGGLPHLPDKAFPPTAKRKSANTPTALCNDDNYSFSRNFDYTCKGHGGVKKWTYESDIEITPADDKYFED